MVIVVVTIIGGLRVGGLRPRGARRSRCNTVVMMRSMTLTLILLILLLTMTMMLLLLLLVIIIMIIIMMTRKRRPRPDHAPEGGRRRLHAAGRAQARPVTSARGRGQLRSPASCETCLLGGSNSWCKAYIYIYTYIYIYIYAYTYTHTYTHTHTYTCTYTYTYTYTYTRVFVYLSLSLYIYINIYIHIVYIHRYQFMVLCKTMMIATFEKHEIATFTSLPDNSQDSAKGGGCTGCSGLHYIIGCVTI